MKIWECKIGTKGDPPMLIGSDSPMRRAVQAAFLGVTGVEDDFTYSGWGAALTEVELALVENREPSLDVQISETQAHLAMLLAAKESQ